MKKYHCQHSSSLNNVQVTHASDHQSQGAAAPRYAHPALRVLQGLRHVRRGLCDRHDQRREPARAAHHLRQLIRLVQQLQHGRGGKTGPLFCHALRHRGCAATHHDHDPDRARHARGGRPGAALPREVLRGDSIETHRLVRPVGPGRRRRVGAGIDASNSRRPRREARHRGTGRLRLPLWIGGVAILRVVAGAGVGRRAAGRRLTSRPRVEDGEPRERQGRGRVRRGVGHRQRSVSQRPDRGRVRRREAGDEPLRGGVRARGGRYIRCRRLDGRQRGARVVHPVRHVGPRVVVRLLPHPPGHEGARVLQLPHRK